MKFLWFNIQLWIKDIIEFTTIIVCGLILLGVTVVPWVLGVVAILERVGVL